MDALAEKVIAEYKRGAKRIAITGLNNISSEGLTRILREGGVPLRRPPKAVTKGITPATIDNHKLPAFPVFSDKWGELVQVEWLKTYQTLAAAGGRQ